LILDAPLQQASLSQNAQWRSQKPFKPCTEFCNLFGGHNTRSYLKNADYVQKQEAHINQYNQMSYPAYAGARADPPSLKKLWRDRLKSGVPPAAG
jgi:hypothetical protein